MRACGDCLLFIWVAYLITSVGLGVYMFVVVLASGVVRLKRMWIVYLVVVLSV